MTLAFRVVLGLPVLLMVGCGAQGASMPRAASALEATKHLWRASCEPAPVVSAQVCSDAKDGVNVLIDTYMSLNEELPE
jgi:hypothetical protein